MTIGFILNGEDVEIKARSGDRLIDLLRSRFGLLGAQADCRSGGCGKCLVLFDGRLAPSCLVPAFKARGREIITIEGFSQTDDFQDIRSGFQEAGLETCGFCEAGRYLVAATLLERKPRPSREEILEEMDTVHCRCTDPEILVRAVQAAAETRARRLYHRGRQ